MDSFDMMDLSEFEHYFEIMSLLDSDCDLSEDTLCLPPIFDLPPPPPPIMTQIINFFLPVFLVLLET